MPPMSRRPMMPRALSIATARNNAMAAASAPLAISPRSNDGRIT
jgi:hypothetical protein